MTHARKGIEQLHGMRMIFQHASGFNGARNTEDATRRAHSQRRLTTALLLSLLAHALLLSLQFGIRGLGLPGLQLPWDERRAYAPALNIRIAGVNSTTSASANAVNVAPLPPLENNVRHAEIPSGSSPAPAPGLKLLQPSEKAPHRVTPRQKRKRSPSTAKQPHKARAPQRHPHRKSVPAKPHPRLVAKEQPAQDSFSVPIATSEPINATGRQEQAPEMVEPHAPPAETDAREQALAAQREEERLQREHEIENEIAAQKLEEESARRQAQEQEAQRQAEQIARQQAAQQREEENLRRIAQIEALRLEEENAKRQAMELEAQRQAVQQLEEERQRRARQLETARQEEENARRQAEELEARRQAEQMAQQQAAQQREEERLQQGKRLEEARRADENARREAADHEARAQAASPAPGQALVPHGDNAATSSLSAAPQERPTSPSSGASAVQAQDSAPADTDEGPILLSDSDLAAAKVVQLRKVDATRLEAHTEQDARRRTIFGGADDDIVLKMYIDRWRQTVERNGNPDREQSQVQGDAEVTVVIRSDGSIENVIIHRSDELHELDQTVRRIAASPGQQNAFPPDLLRRYDVVEIRRVWRFGGALRILEKGD
ncbi:hypothetical protein [Herbaspirillum sp. ST 5-3]|uniref:hypothetical protein n=1 Tax=Oxalobacteraceae TaxID=75682 RepID=UPI0010A3779A|nr:hypothetical protein [Herbaspirillum sp. ST 5-3]